MNEPIQPPPSTNGSNGRARGGRFAAGNRGGPGNPHAAKVAKLRSALLRAVKPGDVQAVVTALLKSAKGGDVAAAKELFTRTLGAPEAADVLERLEQIEQRLDAAQRGAS